MMAFPPNLMVSLSNHEGRDGTGRRKTPRPKDRGVDGDWVAYYSAAEAEPLGSFSAMTLATASSTTVPL